MSKRKGAEHTQQLNRLNRVAGQIRGVAKMIEDQRYCMDILTQIKAVKSAISAVEQNVIEQHLNHCLHKAIDSKNTKETTEMLKEIKELLKKTSK